MTRGESTWHRNALVPIHRNGKLEDVYLYVQTIVRCVIATETFLARWLPER